MNQYVNEKSTQEGVNILRTQACEIARLLWKLRELDQLKMLKLYVESCIQETEKELTK